LIYKNELGKHSLVPPKLAHGKGFADGSQLKLQENIQIIKSRRLIYLLQD